MPVCEAKQRTGQGTSLLLSASLENTADTRAKSVLADAVWGGRQAEEGAGTCMMTVKQMIYSAL